jgi:hypothetical protein
MGVVIHVGRKTHRQYRTPVMVFCRANRFIIALTYGRDSQWVQNILVANGCKLITQNRKLRSRIPTCSTTSGVRICLYSREFARFILGNINVSDFLELTIDQDMASQ